MDNKLGTFPLAIDLNPILLKLLKFLGFLVFLLLGRQYEKCRIRETKNLSRNMDTIYSSTDTKQEPKRHKPWPIPKLKDFKGRVQKKNRQIINFL